MKTLLLSATVLALLSACSQTMTTTLAVSETEKAMCDAWQTSLPTRSRDDTAQTFDEIGAAYDTFEAVCRRTAF